MLFRARRQGLSDDHRLAKRVDRTQSFGDGAVRAIAIERQGKQNGHRAAETMAGDIQGLERMLEPLLWIGERFALQREPQLVEHRPARGAHIAVETRMHPQRLRIALDEAQ